MTGYVFSLVAGPEVSPRPAKWAAAAVIAPTVLGLGGYLVFRRLLNKTVPITRPS